MYTRHFEPILVVKHLDRALRGSEINWFGNGISSRQREFIGCYVPFSIYNTVWYYKSKSLEDCRAEPLRL